MSRTDLYLNLDLNGIQFILNIKHYVNAKNYKNNSIYDYLCYTDMNFVFDSKNIRFSPYSDCLFCFEVDAIADMIEKHLNNKFKKIKSFQCVSPDLHFVFYPQSYVPSGQAKNMNNKLCSMDVNTHLCTYNCMELFLTFVLDGTYGDHQLKIVFDNQNLEYLLIYLNYIIGDIDINSDKIKNLIEKRIIQCRYPLI